MVAGRTPDYSETEHVVVVPLLLALARLSDCKFACTCTGWPGARVALLCTPWQHSPCAASTAPSLSSLWSPDIGGSDSAAYRPAAHRGLRRAAATTFGPVDAIARKSRVYYCQPLRLLEFASLSRSPARHTDVSCSGPRSPPAPPAQRLSARRRAARSGARRAVELGERSSSPSATKRARAQSAPRRSLCAMYTVQ